MFRLKSALLLYMLAISTMTGSLAGSAWARPKYKILHAFTGGDDGGGLFGSLLMDGAGNLYGTTRGGGTHIYGTVFELSPSPHGRWKETVLYNFCTIQSERSVCGDGALPDGGLVFDRAGNLYGTTSTGGPFNNGEIFELMPGAGGWDLSALSDKASLGLVLDRAGNLYGFGGPGYYNGGDVFELSPSPNGWTETVLYSFDLQNGDGFTPESALIFDPRGNLYGTTKDGGNWGFGTAFKLRPGPSSTLDLWQEQILHSFPAFQGDGQYPYAGFVLDQQGNLYGATADGGAANETCTAGCGTIFELTPQRHGGWKETILHEFPYLWNGAAPLGTLMFDKAGNMYGTTVSGGKGQDICTGGCGVVFKMTPGSDGKWKYTVLHRFDGSDGAGPWAALSVDDKGNVYGTTQYGGSGYYGVVFEITP